MAWRLWCDGTCLGTVSRWRPEDDGANLRSGTLVPSEGYERFRPLFRLLARAVETDDEILLRAYVAARDTLPIVFVDDSGVELRDFVLTVYDVEGDDLEVELLPSPEAA